MNTAQKILKENGLNRTHCREEIISIFLDEKYALSHADLEKRITNAYDRVTIYRTLNTFLDNGLLHKIQDDSGSFKYALCSGCNHIRHRDNHIHFTCKKCHLSECLYDIAIPDMLMPEGYSAHDASVLVNGWCKNCRA